MLVRLRYGVSAMQLDHSDGSRVRGPNRRELHAQTSRLTTLTRMVALPLTGPATAFASIRALTGANTRIVSRSALMTRDRILVAVAGLPAIGRALRDRRHSEINAVLTPSGRQEATVLVTGAYTPGVIILKHGRPVRLKFIRQGTAACSEEVVFPDLARRVRLRDGELVPVDFTPEQAGEYEFTSGEGSLHGKIIAQ